MRVGVLSFQGAVTPHLRMLESLGVNTVRVTDAQSLNQCDRLVIPGGESTTMLKLIESNNMWEPLDKFLDSRPCWGTCAGAILLAKKVSNPSQKSFQKINIEALRNAYGSQLDSFKAILNIPNISQNLEVDFIRAPKLRKLDDCVNVLCVHDQNEVLLQQNHILVSSFHTELGQDTSLHKYFLSI
jgi:5'-phosphate synthase pdxT subunit